MNHARSCFVLNQGESKMMMRSVVTVTVIAACAMMIAGCKTKKNIAEGVELEEPITVTDVGAVTDESGASVTGARFEDSLDKVQGLNFEPVYFGFDSYVIPPVEMAKIQAVADHLKNNAGHVLVVEGNTDERGSNEYNLSLGENRAQTVRTALVNLGILQDRIQTRSFGEEKPAVQGVNESAWKMNRRAEFSFYQSK
jgi:peptidoglycan-associated lipoprotein